MNFYSYKRNIRQVYIAVLALWVIFYCTIVKAQDDYIIAINDAYSYKIGAKNARALFNQIYAPTGIKPVVEFYPALRGLKLVNEGQLDAEAGRTIDVSNRYRNLIKVSYPITRHKNGYFCLSSEACETTEKTRYAVISGFEAGKKYCKDNKLNCLIDQSYGLLAKAFESGAIDVLISNQVTVTKALCSLKSKVVYLKELPALSTTNYHLIHKKHQHLEPVLAASIQNLTKTGEISRFLDNASVVNTGCLVEVVELP